MDTATIAAAVITLARTNADMSAVEYDYQVKIGGPVADYLTGAAYEIAQRGHDGGTEEQRQARYEQLWQQITPEIEAYTQRCHERQFAGWSAAARAAGGRLRYAD